MKPKRFGYRVVVAILAFVAAFPDMAWGQGSLYYRADLRGANVVPPVDTPAFGSALIELSGTTAIVRAGMQVFWFDPTETYIRGPAGAGVEASVIFDLGRRAVTPGPQGTVQFQWKKTFELSSQQIEELESGLWYFEIASLNQPEGHLRGQFVFYPVPEPTTVGLLSIGASVLLVSAWHRRRHGLWTRQTLMKRRACLAAILIVLAGASTNSAVAQGTLEFRTTLPDDFTPDPRHWFNMPPGQGQLFLEPGQVRFTVIYISIRYVPYVGYLNAAAPSGEQSQSLDLLAFGTRTEASFGDGNWGSIYRGAIPLTQFTTTELDGLLAGSWQLRFSTPDNLSDYLGGTFVAVPEPSVLGLAVVAVACSLCLRPRSRR